MRVSTTQRRSQYGFTLVELMVVVAILGVLASIAIPTVALWMRRVKTGEARIQIAKMYDATVGYFASEHVMRGDVDRIGEGGGLAEGTTHRCPHPEGAPEGGSAGVTPATTVNCNLGSGGRCTPTTVGADPSRGTYPFSEWADNQVWSELSFQLEQAHYFHYNYVATNTTSGYGACQFTAQAFGNLDDDTQFSTFERTGAADLHGVNAAAGLYINLIVE
jgi:type IV pilus assembly protein PilA